MMLQDKAERAGEKRPGDPKPKVSDAAAANPQGPVLTYEVDPAARRPACRLPIGTRC